MGHGSAAAAKTCVWALEMYTTQSLAWPRARPQRQAGSASGAGPAPTMTRRELQVASEAPRVLASSLLRSRLFFVMMMCSVLCCVTHCVPAVPRCLRTARLARRPAAARSARTRSCAPWPPTWASPTCCTNSWTWRTRSTLSIPSAARPSASRASRGWLGRTCRSTWGCWCPSSTGKARRSGGGVRRAGPLVADVLAMTTMPGSTARCFATCAGAPPVATTNQPSHASSSSSTPSVPWSPRPRHAHCCWHPHPLLTALRAISNWRPPTRIAPAPATSAAPA